MHEAKSGHLYGRAADSSAPESKLLICWAERRGLTARPLWEQASLQQREWDAVLRPARELRRDLEAQLARCQACAAEAARAAEAAQVWADSCL